MDADLTSLQECRGIRRYVKSHADKIGVCGFIQRYHAKTINIVYEGTPAQIDEFKNFIKQTKGYKMIDVIRKVKEELSRYRSYDTFDIAKNKLKRIVTGAYSGTDFDKLSEYSADSIQAR